MRSRGADDDQQLDLRQGEAVPVVAHRPEDPDGEEGVVTGAKEDAGMSKVTYFNQPAIHGTKGSVPLAGNSRLYTVKKVLWPEDIESYLTSQFIGSTLHVCCGKSKLGDIRLDLNEDDADIKCDASDMRGYVVDSGYETVLCDPPYNGKFQWNHDLLSELARVANTRIIFQHWFLPADKVGNYKKDHKFQLTSVCVWQPQTYFGRVQVISIFDKRIRQA